MINRQIWLRVVPEIVWAFLRQQCNSFATMSGHVVFSDILTLNPVSVIKEDFSYSSDKSDSLFSL